VTIKVTEPEMVLCDLWDAEEFMYRMVTAQFADSIISRCQDTWKLEM